MLKRFCLAFIILIIISLGLAKEQPLPRIYLEGYHPLIFNKVDVYKLYGGLNYVKSQPYWIKDFEPETKEEIDYSQEKVIIHTKIDKFELIPPRTISFNTYFANLQEKAFYKSMLSQYLTQSQQTTLTKTGMIKEFSLELPSIAVPKAVQKVLGSSAGRLNIDGTEKISMEVGSTKRKNVAIYESDTASQLDIKMRQDTNLRLTGTIGEKIGVNLKYNSSQDQQFFDPDNINIKYTGTEDELFQIIEGGNIALSLPGSHYISYSAASQGLFGITSKLKYKNLDLTFIASTEEGQKNTQHYVGTSQADSTIFRSRDYAPRTMYYLADPYDLYELYTQEDVSSTVPAGWVNNAIKTDPTGAWIIKNPNLLPANGTVRVFIDDGNANNNVASAVGDTIFFSPTNFYVPYYDELIEGTDFITDYNAGIIRLNKTIDRRTTVAVKYTQKDGIPVPANSDVQDGILHVKVLRRRNQEYDPEDPNNVWHYQMRNVYDMHKNNIKSDGFTLDVYTLNVDLTRNYLVPDSLATSYITTYTDYLKMDSNGDGLINGDDNTVNLSTGLITIPFIQPFDPLGDGIIYTDEGESINYLDISFYLSVKGKIGRESVDLAQGGILKGSVSVKVNGIKQKENVDYIVDYDFGRITFLTSAGKDPDAKIEIDYEYRSTFDISSKTLTGVRADWNLTDWAKLGGTFIYRSENVTDRRPRIGNENIEMYMTDIDGSLTVKPAFITRMLDALPLINTSAESRFTLSGELAYTIPNIYGDPHGKKNEAYIDDMEAIMDSYPLGVTIGSWSQASKPWNTSLAKGRTIWYNPKNIHREEVEDPATLTDREKKESITTLAIKVFPSNLGIGGSEVWSWGGVMKYLGNQLDFSQKKYIELMVKIDKKASEATAHPVLRIDLGEINEDFYTEYGGLNVLNTEDKNHDGVLTLEEDTGLDGIPDGQPGDDPNDNADDSIDQFGDYPFINGTEGNRVLDTEDLNNDGVLNTLDRYFSYSVSLTDSPFMVSENDFGWRLYRIPLTDPSVYEIVNNAPTGAAPTLKKISYGRIVIETDQTVKVLLYDINVVGNKWEDFYIRDLNGQIVPDNIINTYNISYLSGIVNNQRNSAHYTSPPGTYYIEDRRESSESALSMEIQNLQPGQQVLLRQRLFEPYSLLSYNKIKFWVYPELSSTPDLNPDSLDIIFRIGADSLNFYQVRERIHTIDYIPKMNRNYWTQFTYSLQEFTKLKELFPDDSSGEYIEGNKVYTFKGTPTLTNVRDIYLGVYIPDDLNLPKPYNGTIYFNDMRVSEPYEEIGVAKRLSLNSVFADLITLDIDYEDKSENFNTVIQRGRINTFTSSRTLNILNKFFLNKLFPNSWGLDIPLSLSRNYNLGIPRFLANSDLLYDNIIDPAEKDRQRTESLVYAADFGFSQRTAPKSPLLLYTINRTSLSGRIEKSYRYTPTTVDTTFNWRGTLNYNLSIPSDKVSFTLFRNYRLGWFPSTFNNSFTLNNSEPQSYNWEKREGVYGWYPRTQTVPTKTFTSNTNISWGLTSDISLSARLNTERDLKQKIYWKDINIGKMTQYVQDLGLNYNPNYLRDYINLTASAEARYSDSQRKYFQNTDEGQITMYQSDGNSNRTIRTNLTLLNSNVLSSWAAKLSAAHLGKEDKKKQEETKDLENELKYPSDEDIKKKEEERRKEEEWKKQQEESGKYEEGDKDYGKGFIEETDSGKEYYPPEEPGLKDETDSTEPPKDKDKEKESTYFPATLLNLLSKIKNITMTYQNSYIQSYSRKDDRPPFLFQIGLPHTTPAGYLDSVSDDNTISIGSGITFSRNFDSIISYSYSLQKNRASASNQTEVITFPDLTLSFMNFEEKLRLNKFLTGARLNTGIQYTTRATGDLDWIEPKQEAVSIALNPLLGFTATFFKNLNTNLSYSITSATNTTDMDTYDIVKTNLTHSVNSNISYSFTRGKGFTVPFTKKKIHINNELVSSLSILFEKNYDKTKGRESSQVDRDYMHFAITPSATYQFNPDIRGGLTGTWDQTSDNKRDTGVRTFSLGVWVELNL